MQNIHAYSQSVAASLNSPDDHQWVLRWKISDDVCIATKSSSAYKQDSQTRPRRVVCDFIALFWQHSTGFSPDRFNDLLASRWKVKTTSFYGTSLLAVFFFFNLPHQNFLDYFPQVCRSFSTSFNRSRESSRMVKQLWRVCRSYGLRTPRMRTKTKLKYNYVNVRFWLLIEALFFYNLKTSLLLLYLYRCSKC